MHRKKLLDLLDTPKGLGDEKKRSSIYLPAREIEPRRVNAALGVQRPCSGDKTDKLLVQRPSKRGYKYRPRTWLHDGVRLLEAVAALVVPEREGAVVTAAHRHAILVHGQGVDWSVMPTEVLQKPNITQCAKTLKLCFWEGEGTVGNVLSIPTLPLLDVVRATREKGKLLCSTIEKLCADIKSRDNVNASVMSSESLPGGWP